MRTLKQALKCGLVQQKVHIIIKYNHKTWVKSIGIQSYKKKGKITNENVRKYRDIKLVAT